MRPYKVFKDDIKHSDLEKFGLLGPVKREMQTLYKAHLQAGNLIQGKIEIDYSGQEKNYVVTYDENGFILKKEEFGTNGHTIELFENKLHTKTIKYKPDGTLNETTVITYDEKGKLLTYTSRTAEGKVRYRSVHVYDNVFGKILENINYKDETDTEVSGKTVYTYNENGDTTSIIQYNGDGSIRHKSITTYNGKGKKIEWLSEYFEKSMIPFSQRDVYRYNSHGDCIEMVQYKLDGTIKDTFTYNYEYDSEGKKIVREHRNDYFDLKPGETEKLEYDQHGNWIKKTIFYKKIPVNTYVRDIVYYSDAVDRELIHPLANVVKKEEVEDTSHQMPEMKEKDAKWLADTPNLTADNFPAVRYYMLMHREMPSVITYTGPYIEALTLLEELKENLDAKLIHSYGTVWNSWGEKMIRYTLEFPGYPYLLQATGITGRDAEEFDVPDNIIQHDDDNIYTSQFQLLYPSEASGKRDTYFESELNEYIEKCSVDKKPDKPVINMIEVSGNGFVMQEHPVDDDFEIDDLDINYGYGFEEFHEELMIRFNTSTKGLVLFHGEPGTGKTYYIRHLLRSMVANKKVVIYMPPNMVDHLVEPAFMTFLTTEVKAWSEDGNFCVLLIEDAEPLLAKRQEGIRIQGITNLLNMSDGLLNDMLNLQIICTFNVGLRKLDSALLRPGRLIARKEFKALSELDANLLAQRIGIKHHFKGPATLGEIYAMRKNQNILVHDVDSGENSSTHIDDLI